MQRPQKADTYLVVCIREHMQALHTQVKQYYIATVLQSLATDVIWTIVYVSCTIPAQGMII